MAATRREFLKATAAFLGSASMGGAGLLSAAPRTRASLGRWDSVRGEFDLTEDYVHLACLLLASHPLPVRIAIERYRQALNENPTLYAEAHRWNLELRARRVAAAYLGADRSEVALTRSTTEGIGLLYSGLRVRADQEMLTTTHDYPMTLRALDLKSLSSGAPVVHVPLDFDPESITEGELVERVLGGITARTRVVGLTWVHSKTGLKFPVRRLTDRIAGINRDRDREDRILVVVDGVHGLGVEDFTVSELGCDFFIAGTHKWLFGPRGTGLIWGHPRAHDAVMEIVPTFTPDGTFGGRLTPGGFKAFEHDWALPEAFVFHEAVGKQRVASRVHELNRILKNELRSMSRMRLHTPMASELSAGITCFDVDGMGPRDVVHRLEERGVIGSVTPYREKLARLTPGLINTPEEVERAVDALRRIAA